MGRPSYTQPLALLAVLTVSVLALALSPGPGSPVPTGRMVLKIGPYSGFILEVPDTRDLLKCHAILDGPERRVVKWQQYGTRHALRWRG